MKIKNLLLCSLFAAVTAVLAQIVIPIGPVPISLATFSVFCAGALLGSRRGAISQAIYVLLGAVGVPVFAMFKGGFAILVGPTGGYIFGYILAAWVVGLIAERAGNGFFPLALACVAGFFAYMIPGTCWYMFVMGAGPLEALLACVVPFLPGDALKIALAVVLTSRLRPVIERRAG